jgi:hypothetical protein
MGINVPEIGMLGVYIALLGLKNGIIGSLLFPDLS